MRIILKMKNIILMKMKIIINNDDNLNVNSNEEKKEILNNINE